MIDLNHLRIFERVASCGGFSAAAREMGLPRSNVSRAVTKLEEALGTRLMQRTTREVNLTPAGIALIDRASAIMSDLDAALTYMNALTGTPSGPLRISATTGLGIKFLGRAMPEFLRRHPAIELTLHLESSRVDLLAEGNDVALRFGALPDSNLVAQRLSSVPRVLCAASAYLATAGTPGRPEELEGHAIVDLPTPDGRPRRWEFEGPRETVTVSVDAGISVDEVLTLQELVLGGGGIGTVPNYLCADDIAAGRLVRLLPEWRLPAVPLWLVFPSRRELALSVRAFADYMREVEPTAPWHAPATAPAPASAASPVSPPKESTERAIDAPA